MKEDRIIKWLGVSIKRGNDFEILGKVCAVYESLGEEKSKEKFVADRIEEFKGFLENYGIKKEFDLKKSMEKYIFW